MAISYWWVNHKQTHAKEINGGYIWSPKTKSNGARNEGYLNLARTRPGDVVFSYADTALRCVGVVSGSFYEAPKPADFGQAGERWNDSGWLVPITWNKLESALRPRDHMGVITPLLPERFAPIRANGHGNEAFYLTAISAELGVELFRLLSLNQPSLEGEVLASSNEAIGDQIESTLQGAADLGDTEALQVVKARKGHGLYRLNLISVEQRCRLTGVVDPRFLVASHIKPWRDCETRNERLDGHNGLLLAPHIDRLFDQGWISFEDDGALLVADDATRDVLARWAIELPVSAGSFSQRQQDYLRFHREKVFRLRSAALTAITSPAEMLPPSTGQDAAEGIADTSA